MTASPDAFARFAPVAPVPAYADVCVQPGMDPVAREAIESARREAIAETRLLAFESGLLVDCSSFVAEHADHTPTTRGMPVLRRSPVDMAVESVLDRVWVALGAIGSQVVDCSIRCTYVRRQGRLCLVALHELTAIECASVLAGVRL